jgi:hypothetical protein
MSDSISPEPKASHARFVALATVLARAHRGGELAAAEVLPVLRHQLRKLNTNAARKAPYRSDGAQEVIQRYEAQGTEIPKNSSPDALHCDHVFKLTVDHLQRLHTRGDWWVELDSLRAVVCVTAAENYALEKVEAAGYDGWGKYAQAGIVLAATDASSA